MICFSWLGLLGVFLREGIDLRYKMTVVVRLNAFRDVREIRLQTVRDCVKRKKNEKNEVVPVVSTRLQSIKSVTSKDPARQSTSIIIDQTSSKSVSLVENGGR